MGTRQVAWSSSARARRRCRSWASFLHTVDRLVVNRRGALLLGQAAEERLALSALVLVVSVMCQLRAVVGGQQGVVLVERDEAGCLAQRPPLGRKIHKFSVTYESLEDPYGHTAHAQGSVGLSHDHSGGGPKIIAVHPADILITISVSRQIQMRTIATVTCNGIRKLFICAQFAAAVARTCKRRIELALGHVRQLPIRRPVPLRGLVAGGVAVDERRVGQRARVAGDVRPARRLAEGRAGYRSVEAIILHAA